MMRKLQTVQGEVSLVESDISYIESSGNYIKIWIGEELHLVRDTLTRFLQHLDKNIFWRVHRSYVVNSTFIARLESSRAGLGEVYLRNGKVVPVSRKRKNEIVEAFQKQMQSLAEPQAQI